MVEKLKFGQDIKAEFFVTFFKAEVWFRQGAEGLVKILKLKFGQYFEADAYLRFDNIWKTSGNWGENISKQVKSSPTSNLPDSLLSRSSLFLNVLAT